jgi:hypothetical protein
VILGLGANDISHKGKKVTGVATQVLGIYGHKLKLKIEELVRAIHVKFSGVVVLAFDALPRKTTGFANSWARVFADRVNKQNELHNHVSIMARYMMPRRDGKGPLLTKEALFQNDKVHLCRGECAT